MTWSHVLLKTLQQWAEISRKWRGRVRLYMLDRKNITLLILMLSLEKEVWSWFNVLWLVEKKGRWPAQVGVPGAELWSGQIYCPLSAPVSLQTLGLYLSRLYPGPQCLPDACISSPTMYTLSPFSGYAPSSVLFPISSSKPAYLKRLASTRRWSTGIYSPPLPLSHC